MKSIHIKLISMIIISCLGIIVYSNTFLCSFHLDDGYSIVDSSHIRNLYDLANIWNFWPCRFLTYLSFALNYHFNGLHVLGYHLINLGVHLAAAVLVWWLTFLTFSTPVMKQEKIARHANVISLFAGLIFVAHPVQTEAVTYIVQRAASMACLFYLASVCFYVRSRLLQEEGSALGYVRIYYIGSLLAALAAMFTKEMSITLPLTILLYEFSFLRTKGRINGRYLFPFLLTLFIIPLTMFLTRSVDFKQMRLVTEKSLDITPVHYLLTQFRVMITYIRLVFLPFDQNLDYDYPVYKSIFEWPVLISFISLTAILFWAKGLFVKYRLVSFSIFWFFLTLLPESSLLPINDVIFEHRLYLPMAGFSIFLVSGMYYLGGKNSIKTMVIILTMITMGFSILTYQRNKVWKDELSLWNDTVPKSTHKARPYSTRGLANYIQGDLVQAMSDYNKSIEIDPTDSITYNNRGMLWGKQGDSAEAIADFNKAIEISPRFAEAYHNRGRVYYKEGDLTKAMSDFNKDIQIDPNYSKGYGDRALIYIKRGDLSRALSDLNESIEKDPGNAEFYYNRGIVLARQGDLIQAVADYDKAVELNPDHAEVYVNLGSIYAQKGILDRAMVDFTKAIELGSLDAEAYANRGAIFAQTGSFTQAMSDFKRAIEINPDYAQTYNNRAIFYYQLKEYDRACADVRKAEALGYPVDPGFISVLKKASAREGHAKQ